jgi:ADP-ribose pyrophosphatase YjhB (NUDIX family)
MARGIRVPGVFDKIREPAPRLIENYVEPRPWRATWFDPPLQPDLAFIDQAYGICFTEDGEILLICSHDVDGVTPYWNLPGGGLEAGETLEGCLSREVAEEACAHITACRYLGCQRVDELHHPDGPQSYYQARLWARVELDRWEPKHETFERRLVRPEEFLSILAWGQAKTAAVVLEGGLRLDSESRGLRD